MSLDVYLDNGFTANITHNLCRMADAAGIYLACWRPHEMLQPELAAILRDAEESKGYHHEDTVRIRTEIESAPVYARDLIDPLRDGLARLRSNRTHFETFNAPNGWGLYEHFVPWVERYLAACEENPDAVVRVLL